MRRGFPPSFLLAFGTVVCAAQSPYESSADFAKYADEIARTSATESRAAGVCPDHFPDQHGHALSVEDEHRDDGFLGWRAGRRK